ncbi:MAG: flagellar biosynthesis regulator FlaF [Gemmatimonadales bacterium]
MSRTAARAYSDVDQVSASGRQLEASALFRVARALQQAQDQWGTEDGEARMDEALKLNQRLWTFFQAELSAPDNPIAPEIKFNLLQLIRFIDQRTFEVIAFPAPEKLTALININRNIAAGLAAQPAGAAA